MFALNRSDRDRVDGSNMARASHLLGEVNGGASESEHHHHHQPRSDLCGQRAHCERASNKGQFRRLLLHLRDGDDGKKKCFTNAHTTKLGSLLACVMSRCAKMADRAPKAPRAREPRHLHASCERCCLQQTLGLFQGSYWPLEIWRKERWLCVRAFEIVRCRSGLHSRLQGPAVQNREKNHEVFFFPASCPPGAHAATCAICGVCAARISGE